MHGFEFLKLNNELRTTLEELSCFQCFLLKPITHKNNIDKQHKDAD